MHKEAGELRYVGRFGQTCICLGRLFRTFIFQNEWKVLPMAGVIAGLVFMAIGNGLFTTMEGTLQGTFALTCVCIWNGFFNSIQSICRERPILKREHRAGLHITSYVFAQLIYQMILCILQSVITLIVCRYTKVIMPETGILLEDPTVELCITLVLITFAADMLALLISALVHSTTTAMTLMPFMLIIQLVFAGFFALPESLSDVADLMLSKWGIQSLCALGRYNDLPAVVIWNKLRSSGNMDLGGVMSMGELLGHIEEEGMRDQILAELGKANYNEAYISTFDNLGNCWGQLLLYALIFAAITIILLEFIDKDKR